MPVSLKSVAELQAQVSVVGDGEDGFGYRQDGG